MVVLFTFSRCAKTDNCELRNYSSNLPEFDFTAFYMLWSDRRSTLQQFSAIVIQFNEMPFSNVKAFSAKRLARGTVDNFVSFVCTRSCML